MNYWDGRRVLVTGGAGFLGRHIVARLEKAGAEISVPRSREYDLRQESAVERLYDDFPCDLVIHAAGRVGGIAACGSFPSDFFHENLSMGLHLIEHARRRGIAKFVQIGTVCEYPKFAPVPFKEADLWNGFPEETNAPYGLAKKALLVQGQANRQQHGQNVIHLLLTNLYGPHADFDPRSSHVIPGMIRKFLEAKDRGDAAVTLWGTGEPTRDFLYVDDAAEAVLLAAERYDSGEPVNLGSCEEISIRDLAGMIRRACGFTGAIEWDVSKPDGHPRRCVDTSRALDSFGFSAGTPFEAGIKKTVDWFQGFQTSRMTRPKAIR